MERLAVAQVSKPAVSPLSKSADRGLSDGVRLVDGSQVWKPAAQQTGKSALPGLRSLRAGDFAVTKPDFAKA
jgi:hypothetical protein